MTSSLPLNPLGSTGLLVSSVTLGGGPLGSMPQLFGREVPEHDAIETVAAALDAGILTIDTSNGYSGGESERRLGTALAAYGALPEHTLVITKVDALDGDYSGERVRRSLAESSERLGIAPLPVVHLHDPEFHDFDMMTAPGGAVDQLVAARDRGEIGHIGLAGGDTRVTSRYWDLGVFELLLVHNRWTVADRSAGDLLARAQADGAGLINAAVLGGGALTDPVRVPGKYGYGPAPAETLDAIERMREVCRRYGTTLDVTAVRFSTRDPRFATTVIGMSSAARVAPNVAAATADLPDELFAELEALVPPEELWLDRR
ncbi:aldo/keto reductase [Microbacterium paludicola]|uniref:Aldo/keto reductase n=1 Tax=Microbacterium paludicola TaxID=300019 RepID=A0A4Y9G0X9_9MICO|nr:aldo/keto reductase [Microbacterium paludicola]MBF0815134.1 aldo/keto reductase [Microbacterium paludicola]TFU34401.1 aldo/keto reductase [Microbacterium paludicola]